MQREASNCAGAGTATGRVLLTGKAVQIADSKLIRNTLSPRVRERADFTPFSAVPLEREGETIGVIVLCRKKIHPFTDKQIALVQNFATQAVIAIENTRLLGELRQRTTACSADNKPPPSDVLKIISRSPFDLPKVLEHAPRVGRTFVRRR